MLGTMPQMAWHPKGQGIPNDLKNCSIHAPSHGLPMTDGMGLSCLVRYLMDEHRILIGSFHRWQIRGWLDHPIDLYGEL